jgi:hypothetical protein
MEYLILAWLSAALCVLLAVIWPLRLLCTKGRFKNSRAMKQTRRMLRKIHAPLGIVTTGIVFMHCSTAESLTGKDSVVGVILLVCMLALCLTWLLKRMIPRHWLMLHRGVTVIMFLAMIFHSFIEFHL